MNIRDVWNEALREIGLQSNDKILLAISGGVDSMVLLDLFHRAHFTELHIAHVNFGLRGSESDADQALVEKRALELGMKFHVRQFDTEKYASENGISIQMAARELRYAWFDELMHAEKLDYLATAHHRDDQVETVLQNMVRGTKRKGLEGIRMVDEKRIRPLLRMTKSDIRNYAEMRQLAYREDESNFSLKYHRNQLRLVVIPELEQINPAARSHIADMASFFQRYNYVVNQLLEPIYNSYEKDGADRIRIPKPENASSALALELFLHERGFTRTDQILRAAQEAETGRFFESGNERLLVDRTALILEPLNEISISEFVFQSHTETSPEPLLLNWELITKEQFDSMSDFTDVLAFAAEVLTFPVTLRRWTDGDRFQPLGLGGTKKVKDFLTDRKVNRFDKERTAVLVADGAIIGVLGHQIDDRYKVVETTKMVYLARSNAQ